MQFEIIPYKKQWVIAELTCNKSFWSRGRYLWLFVVNDGYPKSDIKAATIFSTKEEAQKWIDDVTLNSRQFIDKWTK